MDVLPTQQAIFKLREAVYPSLRARSANDASPFAANDQEPAPERDSRATGDPRRRIAFISTWFRDHSVGKLMLGVVQRLDRTKFRVLVYRCVHFLREDDELTAAFRDAADRFVDLPADREHALMLLRQEELDVAVFPELGMDVWTLALSHQRVAPVQCVFWGHPVTTGNPAMDYYISSAYFDSDVLDNSDSSSHVAEQMLVKHHGSTFSEQVVRFRGLSTFFKRVRSKVVVVGVGEAVLVASCENDTSHKSLTWCRHSRRQQSCENHSRARCCIYQKTIASTSAPRYVLCASLCLTRSLTTCPRVGVAVAAHRSFDQTLMKLHPAFDAVLTGILGRDPLGYIVLLASEAQSGWKEQLRARFRRSLGGFANTRRVLFMPTLPYAEFMALLSFADVILDPYPFGGGVTTLDALALGVYVCCLVRWVSRYFTRRMTTVCVGGVIDSPVVTMPTAQTVPQLAAGFLRYMNVTTTIVRSVDEFVAVSQAVAADVHGLRSALRAQLLARHRTLYEDATSVDDWDAFLAHVSPPTPDN